ncbi:hypothetical protein NECAME_12044, partial [Necator americanus]
YYLYLIPIQVRKRFIRLTPLIALALLSVVIVAILVQVQSVATSSDSLNCVRMYRGRMLPRLGAYLTAIAFLSNLTTISVNYGQIVRHVRRKFSKRKARGLFLSRIFFLSENIKKNNNGISLIVHLSSGCTLTHKGIGCDRAALHEGNDKRNHSSVRISCDLLAAILPDPVPAGHRTRLGAAHNNSLLQQFLRLQVIVRVELTAEVPENFPILSTTIIVFRTVRWSIFVANWLTYASAAGNWIFYAAMNRDLRSLIRYATERRKRSTLSHTASPSNVHRNLRQQMSASMRVLQSLSYRSSLAGSLDEVTCPPSLLQLSPKSSTVSQDQSIIYSSDVFFQKSS